MPSLTSVIKQASRGADLYFVFRFLRLLTMKWTATDAYKYKIIDKKGNALRKSSELESVNEKAAYTMLHRMVFKIRRLIEKVPIVGKSILLNYAAALFLLKEQKDTRIWTDEKYMTRKLMEFLETDWSADAEFLQEEIKNKYGKTSASEFLVEEVEIEENPMVAGAAMAAAKKELEKKKKKDKKEEVEIDEKRKAADDVGMECQECLHKFRHKNPIYGKTKCPKCKSTDLDLAFGEAVELDEYAGTKKRLKMKKKAGWGDDVELEKKVPKLKFKHKSQYSKPQKKDKKKSSEPTQFAFGISRKGGSGAGKGYGSAKKAPIMMGEDELDEALPPHLAKFVDKKGNLKKDAADRVRKGRKERDAKITDRTPKGYGPNEEAPANSAGGGAIAGLDIGLTHKKKQEDEKKAKALKKMMVGESVKMATFAGKDVFIVDSDMFHNCRMGKKKYHRYEKYVGSKRIGQAIREYGLKFPRRPIILQNGENGPMLYLRYGGK